MFLIPFIQKYVLTNLTTYINNIKLGAIIATIILFFVPSMFMGMITPIILKLKLKDMDTAGKISGRINAIATIGGIFGTFLGGFILIPFIGSCNIIFVLIIVMVLLIPLVNYKIKEWSFIFVIIMIIISVLSINILPDVGSSSFIINFSIVDLPDPDGPTKNTNSPFSILKFIFFKAATPCS